MKRDGSFKRLQTSSWCQGYKRSMRSGSGLAVTSPFQYPLFLQQYPLCLQPCGAWNALFLTACFLSSKQPHPITVARINRHRLVERLGACLVADARRLRCHCCTPLSHCFGRCRAPPAAAGICRLDSIGLDVTTSIGGSPHASTPRSLALRLSKFPLDHSLTRSHTADPLAMQLAACSGHTRCRPLDASVTRASSATTAFPSTVGRLHCRTALAGRAQRQPEPNGDRSCRRRRQWRHPVPTADATRHPSAPTTVGGIPGHLGARRSPLGGNVRLDTD